MGKYSKEAAAKVWNNCFATRESYHDAFGREIRFENYGDTNSKYGWELDHIWPANPEKGISHGANIYPNMQPLHVLSNDEKSNELSGIVNNKKFRVEEKRRHEGKVVGKMYVEEAEAYDYAKWQ